MLFSVIVPCYNSAAHVQDCVHALARQTCSDWELIIVDNNSTDDTLRTLESTIAATAFNVPVSIMTEKKRGASAARNAGAAAARGDWLVFTDADCEPAPSWLADLAEIIRDTADRRVAPAAIAGCIMPAPAKNLVETFLSLYTLPPAQGTKIHRAYTLLDGGFPTANFAVRKDVFNAVGGFDISIPIYGEDHDLCRKIYQTGHAILQSTSALVQHHHRATFAKMLKQSYGFGYSHPLLLKRMASGCVIIQLPLKTICHAPARPKIWLDFNQADKKMFFLLCLTLINSWGVLLPVLYFGWLAIAISRRARRRKIPLAGANAPALAVLLLAKSCALTCGRIAGSFKNNVICL